MSIHPHACYPEAVSNFGRLMEIELAGAVDRRALLTASLVARVAVVVRPLAGMAQSPAFDMRETASGSA
jgi:hypothetical protein